MGRDWEFTFDETRVSEKTRESVCAVVVTYHPTSSMLENLSRIRAQLGGVVVVDNGSNEQELDALRFASRSQRIQVIENKENLGIAEALNQGVKWAKTQAFEWVVLFDQDTGITDGFIENMLAAWRGHPQRERIGSIHARHVIPNTAKEVWVTRSPDGSPILPLTAGSMMPMWIFDQIGWFASEYFIDVVDWEYSFRTMAAGFLVIDAKHAILFHEPGHAAETRVFGHTFRPSHHNAIRRYYLTRNRIAFYKKYIGTFPKWILSSAYHQFFKETVMCLIAEDNRLRKLRSIVLGMCDGILGRMGSRDDL